MILSPFAWAALATAAKSSAFQSFVQSDDVGLALDGGHGCLSIGGRVYVSHH